MNQNQNQQMYQGTVNFLIFILLNFGMVTKAGEAIAAIFVYENEKRKYLQAPR